MAGRDYKYVIVGGGLAGASAVEGIRDVDSTGTILLIGSEKHLPYDRPPLTKKLWFGTKKLEEITLHERAWYDGNGVELLLGDRAETLGLAGKRLLDSAGGEYRFGKLLIATGGTPRVLSIPGGPSTSSGSPRGGSQGTPRAESRGGKAEGVCYYRTVDHYVQTREAAEAGKAVVVIGGGFIGSELAAGLCTVGAHVTMVFRGSYLVNRVFPEGLGRALQAKYEERGITILADDEPVSIERAGGSFVTETAKGKRLESGVVVVGAGILPGSELAEAAGLAVEDGIVVNEHLRTSHPDIYAAGDNASFPYQALGRRMRVEHWDNALNQGKYAGWNMAGRGEPYTYMPYFFSDLFEFGYEAVGEIDPRLDVIADWQKENEKGVLYFLRDGQVRGAMMCDVWDKVPAARELIRSGRKVTADDLRGAIQ